MDDGRRGHVLLHSPQCTNPNVSPVATPCRYPRAFIRSQYAESSPLNESGNSVTTPRRMNLTPPNAWASMIPSSSTLP